MSHKSFNPWSVLVAMVGGAIAGLVAYEASIHSEPLRSAVSWSTDWIAYPIGQIFLRLLFFVIVPLVFSALASSVARLGHLSAIGRMGFQTAVMFLLITAFSVVLGMVAMNLVKPGAGFDPAIRSELMEAFAGQANAIQATEPVGAAPTPLSKVNGALDMVLPRNILGAITQLQMLPMILFALLFGAGIGSLDARRRDPIVAVLDSIAEAMVWIVGMALRMAPLAVFCLIFVSTSKFGLGLLSKLGLFVVVVLGLFLVQLFMFYPMLLATIAVRSPWGFLRACGPLMATAFSTSSSNATLPMAIEVSERHLAIRPAVASFVLPLGATMNQNGTALFEGCVVLFVAQVFGIHLDWSHQMLVLLLCVTTSMGVAGIPGGSLPVLMIVMAQVGVPPEGLALVLGVDRLLDMGRTVVNVMGDVVTAAVVEQRHRVLDHDTPTR